MHAMLLFMNSLSISKSWTRAKSKAFSVSRSSEIIKLKPYPSVNQAISIVYLQSSIWPTRNQHIHHLPQAQFSLQLLIMTNFATLKDIRNSPDRSITLPSSQDQKLPSQSRNYRSTMPILPPRTSKLPCMSYDISKEHETTALSTPDPQESRLSIYSVIQTQTTLAIQMIESLIPVMSSWYAAALYPGQHTSNQLLPSLAWNLNIWHYQTLQEKPLQENSSFANYESHPANIPSQFYQMVNLLLTSLKIQPNIEKPNTLIFNITQSVTTFMIPRLKSTTFPRNTNQPIFSQKRSGQQNISGFQAWLVCTTATKHFDLRRFFSEYAITESLT